MKSEPLPQMKTKDSIGTEPNHRRSALSESVSIFAVRNLSMVAVAAQAKAVNRAMPVPTTRLPSFKTIYPV
jgi:hypothetical protein